ncbi:MAG: uncharacterized protein KVP18_000191 [Porospora cf. gigantea A]|nr:MAG: hypothetical protein KVP18_000191 [Porospora cf. gigantea A]
MSVDLIHVIRICRRLSKVVQAFLPYNMDLKPVIEAGMTEASSTDPWALETLLDRKKVTVDVCQPRNKRARTQSQPAAQLVHLSGRCPFCHYSAIYSIQTYVSEVNVGLKFHFGAVASKSKTANLHYLTDRANVRRQLLAITAQWSDQPPMTTGFEELVDKGSGEAASAASAVLTEDGKDEGELPLLSDAVPGRNAELVEEDHCKFIQV